MTDFSARQVETAIEAHEEFGNWSEVKYASKDSVVFDVEIDGIDWPVTKVDGFGGEGQGDEIWVVVSVGTQTFRKEGYYDSHHGSDWDGEFEEVRGVEKTVTVYEEV